MTGISTQVRVVVSALAVFFGFAWGQVSGEVAEKPTHTAPVPSLDRDGRVTFMHNRGARVYQTPDGRVWTCLQAISNPENRRNLKRRKYPRQLNDPRRLADGKVEHTLYTLMHDLSSRPWQRSDGDDTTLRWIENGKLKKYEFKGLYPGDKIKGRIVPGLIGWQMFVDSRGRVFACGKEHLHVYEAGRWTKLKYSWSGKPPHPYKLGALFRQVGDVVFIAQNLEVSNQKTRSAVIAYKDGILQETGWTSHRHVTFLGYHDGKLLVGTEDGLSSLERCLKKPLDEKAVMQYIRQLADKFWKTRQAATRALIAAGPDVSKILIRAMAKSEDIEQRIRLKLILREHKSMSMYVVRKTTLGGYSALEFVFQSRTGRQFYRPVAADAKPLLLCTDGSAVLHKIPLPGKDGFFRPEIETPDGKIIGRDSKSVFLLDPKLRKFRVLFNFGRFGRDKPPRVVAFDQGEFCLKIEALSDSYFWYRPDGRSEATMLSARAIASNVSTAANQLCWQDCSIAPGPEGRLWMLRGTDKSTKTLSYARDGKVVDLPGRVNAKCDAVFPLKNGSSLVVGPYCEGTTYLHLGDNIIQSSRLKDMVSSNYERMLKLVPEGTVFCSQDVRQPRRLIRLARRFWVNECYLQGSKTIYFQGVFDGVKWQETPFLWLQAVDVSGGRLLVYKSLHGKELGWFGIKKGKAIFERLLVRDYRISWHWPDVYQRPYYRGAWSLTPEAMDLMAKKVKKEDPDWKTEDFRSFRTWSPQGWRIWNDTLWGGGVYHDAISSVWHLRIREIAIQRKDGRKDVLMLPDAMHCDFCWLAKEQPGVVWLATDQTLIRLVAEQVGGGAFGPYRVERRFSTRSFGYRIRGPWITGGKDLYFAHGGTMYHTTIKDLLKSPPSKGLAGLTATAVKAGLRPAPKKRGR